MRVAFIGLGRMGLPMARHVAAAGHEVTGFDTDEGARARAVAAGLEAEPSAAGKSFDVVCSSLPDTHDVEQAYAGFDGIFEHAAAGTVCVDLSTISVAASVALAQRAAAAGLSFLDAPVSGTSIHATAGNLVVMAGGDPAALERAEPVLSAFSSSVHHVGPSGSGLRLKLVTNRLLTSHLTAIAEAVVDMEAVGIDPTYGLEIIRNGAVPKLMDYKAQPLIDRDFTPQFTVDLMRKDLRYAAEELPAARIGDAARAILEEAAATGRGNADLAALIEVVAAYMHTTTRDGDS